MENIIKQLATELKTDTTLITEVTIVEDNNMVFFKHGRPYCARLTKGNDKVRKNSVRLGWF